MEVIGQPHAPAALPPKERAPGTHWIGGWVGLRAGVDVVVKRKIPALRNESAGEAFNCIHPHALPVWKDLGFMKTSCRAIPNVK